MTILKQQQRNNKVATKSKVRFNHCSVIYDEAMLEERKGMWFRSKDLQSFRKDIKKSILHSRKVGYISSSSTSNYCLRGIEHLFSREIAAKHRDVRKNHVRRVLLAQANQKMNNNGMIINPEELYFISLGSSLESCERAQLLGEQDCFDAQYIFMEDFNNFHCMIQQQQQHQQQQQQVVVAQQQQQQQQQQVIEEASLPIIVDGQPLPMLQAVR